MSTLQTKEFRRVDCHHHVFPATPASAQPVDPKLDWKTPEENLPWSPELSLSTMDALNIDMAILSYPPGPPPGGNVRKANHAIKEICDKYPDRFGFWAILGDLRNVEAVLEEIAYAFDVLKANGVNIVSSYGEGEEAVYLGDDRFDPIWQELDSRKAAVFMHGKKVYSPTRNPHPSLGVPVVEVPNETFKTASHLVVTGKKRRYPNISFILSHFGGSTPFLAPRVAALSHYMGSRYNGYSLTPEEIMEDFKSFYFDTALSAYDHNLVAMQAFVGPEKIVFGTDFPAVSREIVTWYTNHVDKFYGTEDKKLVTSANLLRLLSNMQ